MKIEQDLIDRKEKANIKGIKNINSFKKKR